MGRVVFERAFFLTPVGKIFIFLKFRAGKISARREKTTRADIFFFLFLSLSLTHTHTHILNALKQMTIRLTNIAGTNANPDLYVSCAGTNYSSTNSQKAFGETVQFVAPAGARADIRVEIFQTSSANTWDISTRVQPYQPELVSSGSVYSRSFQVGYRDYYHLEVPEGLHKVQYTYKPKARTQSSYRSYTDLSVNVPKHENAADYKLYDETAGGYRTMKVYDDQSEVYATDRGIEMKDIRFIYGPRLVKIYASAGLNAATSNENLENQDVDGNGFIEYTFVATIERAETACHDVSTGSIESSHTLDYNDARFYSIRVDQFEALSFTYAQMVVAGNVNVQASSLAEYPMHTVYGTEYFYRGTSCSSPKTCIKTHNFRDLNEIAAVTKPGACAGTAADVEGARFIHFSVEAAVTLNTGTSAYEFSFWGAKEGCGWRPDCKSCAAGTNDDCSWCQGFEGSCVDPPCRGYCASASELQSPTWPASKKTCEALFSCPANSCSTQYTCNDCRAVSGCGWCAAEGQKGVCVPGNTEGPIYTEGTGNKLQLGVCGKWAFAGDADGCDEACAVHDRHPTPCVACSQETNCGYCKTSAVGGCVAGSGSSSTNGECPREDALWASTVEQCAVNDLAKIPTGKEINADGSNIAIKLDKNALICALGSCPSEILRYEVPSTEDGPHDIVATIRTSVPSDKTLIHMLASLDKVPTADDYMAKAVVPPVDPNARNDELVLHFGLCGNAGSKVYFAIEFDKTQSGSEVLDVTFKLEVLPDTIVVLPKNETGFEETKTLLTSGAWLCCGQSRHFNMPMPRGMNSAQTHVSIIPSNPSQIALLSRRGTCPSLSLADVIAKNGTVSSAMETTEDLWYITVVANNSYVGHQTFSLYGWSADIPSDKNTWFEKYFWYAFGSGCAALFLFILACIRSYRIKSKYKKRLNDQVSNALAMHKSFKGFGDVENAENAVAVIQAASEAEEQLVDLIMDLQTKVQVLEEDRIAKEDVARMTAGVKKNSNKSARKPPKGGSAPSLASVEEDNILDPISPSVMDKSKKLVSDWDISGATGLGAPSGAKYSFEILCPDGSIMEISRERQTLGRGVAGISSKKISREQCMLSVDFQTGEVEIEALGKNPMASKKPGMSVWESLESGKRRDLTSQDKFMLLSPDAMLREGIEDETAFVFTLKVSKNPLRQVFGADSTDKSSMPPSISPSPSPSPLSGSG